MDDPTVRVRLYAAARAAVGQAEVHAPAGTVAAILDGIERAHPDFARVRPQCSVLVDATVVHDQATVVPGGAQLDVLPPFAGGSR